jgi:DNA-binding LacI/PurR family transcriptional regulator
MGCMSQKSLELLIPLNLYCFDHNWSNNKELGVFIEDWLNENRAVDAICCTNDYIAAVVLKVLHKLEIAVPDQIAVTGSGNISQYFGIAPDELTTVDTRFDETAVKTFQLLKAIKYGEEIEPQLMVLIKPELIVGKSTVSEKVMN